MTPRRAALVLLAVLMSFALLYRGRHAGYHSGVAAFSVPVGSPSARLQIVGDVRNPGVYQLVDNLLTFAAIDVTRPLCPDLVAAQLGMSRFAVEDGDRLVVDCKAAAATGVITSQPMPSATAFVLGLPFSVNRATADELELLPGVGPVLAQRVVEFRQKNGGFRGLEELLLVEGIGEKKFIHLRQYLKL